MVFFRGNPERGSDLAGGLKGSSRLGRISFQQHKKSFHLVASVNKSRGGDRGVHPATKSNQNPFFHGLNSNLVSVPASGVPVAPFRWASLKPKRSEAVIGRPRHYMGSSRGYFVVTARASVGLCGTGQVRDLVIHPAALDRARQGREPLHV